MLSALLYSLSLNALFPITVLGKETRHVLKPSYHGCTVNNRAVSVVKERTLIFLCRVLKNYAAEAARARKQQFFFHFRLLRYV